MWGKFYVPERGTLKSVPYGCGWDFEPARYYG